MTPLEVFAEHIASDSSPSYRDDVECICGASFDTHNAYAIHILDALAVAGHVIVSAKKAVDRPLP